MKYKVSDTDAVAIAMEMGALAQAYEVMALHIVAGAGRDEPFDDTELSNFITAMEDTAAAHYEMTQEAIRMIETTMSASKLGLHVVKDDEDATEG